MIKEIVDTSCFFHVHLHRDLYTLTVKEEVQMITVKYEERLHNHGNFKTLQFLKTFKENLKYH